MTKKFDTAEIYDVNKTVLVCRPEVGPEIVQQTFDAIHDYALSLEIAGMTVYFDEVVSGTMFSKTSTRCHFVDVTYGEYRMRLVTSVKKVGRVLSIFSYERFHPHPLAQDYGCGDDHIVDLILHSLKRLDDAEFFMTVDTVFDLIHQKAVDTVSSVVERRNRS